ncbi:MAG: gamma-glutamyltransferase family protein [Acidimicrobiales bacterium]
MVTHAPFATTRAAQGMVCSVDHLASSAGVAMLRAGGSAVDAAVAASAVLAVTTQHMCGMGGDLFALVHEPGVDAPHALNASGRAGSGADASALRDAGATSMPFRESIHSVPVPGCVDGWVTLHDRFGRLPLDSVLAPAIALAIDGFPASDLLAWSVRQVIDLPDAADYRASGPIRPGTVIRRPGVAASLQSVVEGGRDHFYLGEFGQGLLALGDGEYVEEDLRQKQANWVEPLHVDALGRRLWTVPPNSQGYLTLASAWIAEGLALPDEADDLWTHLLIEASRQAGKDRVTQLHEHADGQALLDPSRLGARRDAIDPERAAAMDDNYRGGGTIYLCAVDDQRMGVSLIQSNAAGFGSHLIEPSTRIFLQNRGHGFSLEPGHPAEYGPGRRPPHTLSPALVTEDGRLDLVLGTMGGDSQPQVLLQLLARILGHGEQVGDAVAAGRWVLASALEGASGFDTWNELGRVTVQLESSVEAGWRDGLVARGHSVGRGRNFGHAHAIRVDPGGALAGAADPRALTGAAAGW